MGYIADKGSGAGGGILGIKGKEGTVLLMDKEESRNRKNGEGNE